MKKKLVSLLLIGAMAATMVVGCGKTSSSEGSRDEEQVTLRWMQFQVEYAEQVKNMAAAYEEEHPNVKIEVEVIGDDYYDVLKTKASSGDMPDVFMTAGYNEINTYKEYITDMSDQAFVDNIADGAKECVSLDDKVVGLPVQMSGNGIVYNKEIFDQYNLEIPTTVSELENVCKTLKENDITPFTNQFKDDWLLGQFYNYGFANVEDTVSYIESLKTGDAKIADTQEMKDTMKVLDMMLKYGQDKPLDAGWNEAAAMFAQGKQAMIFEGIWAYDTISQIAPDMQVGMFALPTTDDAEQTKMAADVNGVWHVSNTSKHQDVAKDVLNWIVTSDAGKDFLLKECQVIPAMKGMEFEGSNPLSKDVAQYIEDGNTGLWSWPLWPDGFYNESGKKLQEYISNGNGDSEATLQSLDELWTKLAGANQ
ncbi:ABC transporter substrate-binding protein [Blautia producta]|uniref:ABC transporter substrate-binding protein n=1 Tax=Blautia producta TaxID=33035 RepID=UPI0031B5A6A5